MDVRQLPDLTPGQVIRLQDALLANADTLLSSALAVLNLGQVPLARSLAILGLEESGKAIAIHERRVAMPREPEGATFRCAALDLLWSSHERKLEKVHDFLVEEAYWFGVEPADPERNMEYLGTIRSWTRRHDRLKKRGFYVELANNGEPLAPTAESGEATLNDVIAHVHQIGWQLRLGEHIEGKQQDQQEVGVEPVDEQTLEWLAKVRGTSDSSETRDVFADIAATMRAGTPGVPLRNADYRFNPPNKDYSPFANVGKPGYEAETRELRLLAERLDGDERDTEGPASTQA